MDFYAGTTGAWFYAIKSGRGKKKIINPIMSAFMIPCATNITTRAFFKRSFLFIILREAMATIFELVSTEMILLSIRLLEAVYIYHLNAIAKRSLATHRVIAYYRG